MPSDARTDGSGAPHESAKSHPLLSPVELATLLSVPLPTIYRWRSRQQGPPSFRIGRHVRYSLEDIQEWLETRRTEPDLPRAWTVHVPCAPPSARRPLVS